MVINKENIRKVNINAHITVEDQLKDSFIRMSYYTCEISIEILPVPAYPFIKR